MSKKDGYKKIFDFLKEKYASNKNFLIKEFAEYSGLKESSLKVYIRNKLKSKFLKIEKDNFYLVLSEIEVISENDFIKYLSQKDLIVQSKKTLFESLKENAENAILAAIEIHNKPLICYRYQIVTILIINSWELILKAYLSKYHPEVKLFFKDGSTKPFNECLNCVVDKLGKNHFLIRENLKSLYNYRCKCIHLYSDDLDVLLFSLIQKSILLFNKFLKDFFNDDISLKDNLYILPIGFKKPYSPIDYLTNKSAIENASTEIKEFINTISESTKFLSDNNIEETILVPYSVLYKSENRLKNADIIAAINQNKNVNISITEEVLYTNDPNAKKIKIQEETLIETKYTETYKSIIEYCKLNIPNFKRNQVFIKIIKELKENNELHYIRKLEPKNPRSLKKDFYSKNIFNEIKLKYQEIITASVP